MDAMRAFAALAVVLTHARDFLMADYHDTKAWAPFYFLTGLGHQAVIIFFVLSGFWISRTTLQNLEKPNFWRDYLIARLTRVLIVLVPTLIVGGTLDYFGGFFFKFPLYYDGSAHSMSPLSPDSLTVLVFLGNLTFLQGLFVSCFGSNGPLWSLAFEFWFYLWFPSIMLVYRGKLTLFLAALIIAFIFPLLVVYFIIWAMGALAQVGDGRLYYKISFFRLHPKLAQILSLVILLLSVSFSRLSPGLIADMVLGICFSAMLTVMLNSDIIFFKPLNLLVTYGRKASYSLYLVHFPILLFGVAVSGLQRDEPNLLGGVGVLAIAAGIAAIAYCFAMITESRTSALRAAVLRAWVRA